MRPGSTALRAADPSAYFTYGKNLQTAKEIKKIDEVFHDICRGLGSH
jgi:hypothetical protein